MPFFRRKRSSEERELQPPTPSRSIGTAPIILEGVTLETYFVPRDSPEEARALIIVTDAQVTSLTHYLKPPFTEADKLQMKVGQ